MLKWTSEDVGHQIRAVNSASRGRWCRKWLIKPVEQAEHQLIVLIAYLFFFISSVNNNYLVNWIIITGIFVM